MVKLEVRQLAEAAGMGNALVLSRQSGLAYAMCYKLWNAQQTRIDLTTIDRLCDVLRCSPGDLFVRETTAALNKSDRHLARQAAPAESAAGSASESNKCRRIRWID